MLSYRAHSVCVCVCVCARNIMMFVTSQLNIYQCECLLFEMVKNEENNDHTLGQVDAAS